MVQSTKRKLEYQKAYNARPEEVAKRVQNNAARAKAIKAGTARVGDGKDVAHIKSLENGGGNTPGNTKVESRTTNRAWRKGSGSYNPDK
jgi:hypothetical protein